MNSSENFSEADPRGIVYLIKLLLLCDSITAGTQHLLLFTGKIRVVRCLTFTIYLCDPTGTSFPAGIFFETCNRKVVFDNACSTWVVYRLDFGSHIKTGIEYGYCYSRTNEKLFYNFVFGILPGFLVPRHYDCFPTFLYPN